MNPFLRFSAHDNIVSRLIGRIEARNRGSKQGVLEILVKLSGVTAGYSILAWCRLLDFFPSRIPIKKDVKTLTGECLAKAGKPGVSVVIVNWNGVQLIGPCLKALYPALADAGVEYEIIVADNGSTDNSFEFLKNEFPEVKVIGLEKNIGFGMANNLAVETAEHEFLLFLNNDIVLNKDTLTILLGHFSDPALFAVAPKALQPDGSVAEGHSWCGLSDEGVTFYNERQFPSAPAVCRAVPTLYAFGACALTRKNMFAALGGFDPLYYPFYWEDNDLSYRALKRGCKVLYEPSVTVTHEHGASSRRLSPYYILAIMEKNATLFFLKNITDSALARSVRDGLRRKLRRAVRDNDYSRLIAFVLVGLQLPGMLIKRVLEKRKSVVTDAAIMETTGNVANE